MESDLENLEDCLQEIFDKYHIKKININKISDSEFRNTGICYYLQHDEIYIENIPTINISESIFQDIQKIKNAISKRIGQKLSISGGSTYWIIGLGADMMYNTFENNATGDLNIEDLEGCLQEILDKYNIKKSNPDDWPSPLYPNYYISKALSNAIEFDECKSIFHDLYEEILKIKPTIEKRIGREILIRKHRKYPGSAVPYSDFYIKIL